MDRALAAWVGRVLALGALGCGSPSASNGLASASSTADVTRTPPSEGSRSPSSSPAAAPSVETRCEGSSRVAFAVRGSNGVLDSWSFRAAHLTQRTGGPHDEVRLSATTVADGRVTLDGFLGSGAARLEADGLTPVDVDITQEGDFVATTMVAGQTETVSVEGHLRLCVPPR